MKRPRRQHREAERERARDEQRRLAEMTPEQRQKLLGLDRVRRAMDEARERES